MGFSLAWIFCTGVQARHLEDLDKALQKIFKGATAFERFEFELTEKQIAEVERTADLSFGTSHSLRVVVFRAVKDGSTVGYAFEDTVIGKWGPIHYLLALNTDGSVKEALVLDYDEIRGKPVAKRRFLRQYEGKGLQDPLRLRRDIDGVTGATISSRSMTDGIRKLLHIFEAIKPKLL